jgi:hypothetical protein
MPVRGSCAECGRPADRIRNLGKGRVKLCMRCDPAEMAVSQPAPPTTHSQFLEQYIRVLR